MVDKRLGKWFIGILLSSISLRASGNSWFSFLSHTIALAKDSRIEDHLRGQVNNLEVSLLFARVWPSVLTETGRLSSIVLMIYYTHICFGKMEEIG